MTHWFKKKIIASARGPILLLLLFCLSQNSMASANPNARSTDTDETCAKSYTAYLSMNSYTDYFYQDSNYQPSGSPAGPGMSFYLSPMPVANTPVSPHGVPLCEGTYSVKVNLEIFTGSCGGKVCRLNTRLYAGNLPNFPRSHILINDADLAPTGSMHPFNYYTVQLSTTWNTSQGPLYPPLLRGNGSDSALIVPGNDSNVTVQWVGP